MKKHIFTLSLILISFISINAQVYELYYDDTQINNGDTLHMWGPVGQFEILEAHIGVKNTSTTAVSTKVKKIEHSLVVGSSNMFCWVNCYGASTYISPDALSIAPGVVNKNFVGDYSNNDNVGTSYISYVFFNENSVNDSIAVVVEFKVTPVGLEETAANNLTIGNAYPNPASQKITIDYQIDDNSIQYEFILTNMLGQEINRLQINANESKLSMNINELKAGIYFYSIQSNHKVLQTKKLVIR